MVAKGAPLAKAGLSSGSPSGSTNSLGLGPGSAESFSNISLSQSRSRSGSDNVDSSTLVENQNDEDRIERVEVRKQRGFGRTTFMWGLWQCENELTFLLDESDDIEVDCDKWVRCISEGILEQIIISSDSRLVNS